MSALPLRAAENNMNNLEEQPQEAEPFVLCLLRLRGFFPIADPHDDRPAKIKTVAEGRPISSLSPAFPSVHRALGG